MYRFTLSVTVACVLLPGVATAGLITFGTAPDVAATSACLGIAGGSLNLLDEGGVRVQLTDQMGPQNRYACDPSATDKAWTPLDLGNGLRPMTIWWMDGGSIAVESLTGHALLGFTANYLDKWRDPQCEVRVTTNTGTARLCLGAEQAVSFADLGLFDVRQFSISFTNGPSRDPLVQLLAVETAEPVQASLRSFSLGAVPEPGALLLLALAAGWRRLTARR